MRWRVEWAAKGFSRISGFIRPLSGLYPVFILSILFIHVWSLRMRYPPKVRGDSSGFVSTSEPVWVQQPIANALMNAMKSLPSMVPSG